MKVVQIKRFVETGESPYGIASANRFLESLDPENVIDVKLSTARISSRLQEVLRENR